MRKQFRVFALGLVTCLSGYTTSGIKLTRTPTGYATASGPPTIVGTPGMSSSDSASTSASATSVRKFKAVHEMSTEERKKALKEEVERVEYWFRNGTYSRRERDEIYARLERKYDVYISEVLPGIW